MPKEKTWRLNLQNPLWRFKPAAQEETFRNGSKRNNLSPGYILAKNFINPSPNNNRKLHDPRKPDLGTLTGFLIGHCIINYNLEKMGEAVQDICPFKPNSHI